MNRETSRQPTRRLQSGSREKERALATGIYNSGSNIGAIVAPVLIPWLLMSYRVGESAFYVTGALGLLWLLLWAVFYGKPAEKKRSHLRAYITPIPKPQPPTHVRQEGSLVQPSEGERTFGHSSSENCSQTRSGGSFCFWLPSFLKNEYGLDGMEISFPLIVVYTFSSLGSILGGWLPKFLINRGMETQSAFSIDVAVCVASIGRLVHANGRIG